jgi:hypothetical protein
MSEKLQVNFCLKMPDFHVAFRDILHASKSYDMGPTALLPFRKEGRAEVFFFALKNLTASAGF